MRLRIPPLRHMRKINRRKLRESYQGSLFLDKPNALRLKVHTGRYSAPWTLASHARRTREKPFHPCGFGLSGKTNLLGKHSNRGLWRIVLLHQQRGIWTREPPEELPHLLRGIDDASRSPQQPLRELRPWSRPHMPGSGELPQHYLGPLATRTIDDLSCSVGCVLFPGCAVSCRPD